jgi:hypothetical protein
MSVDEVILQDVLEVVEEPRGREGSWLAEQIDLVVLEDGFASQPG